MKYLHIFTCVLGLSLECFAAQKIELSKDISGLMSDQIAQSYITAENSSDIINKHIEFLEGKDKRLANLKGSDENMNSHSYVSMKKCIACVVSLFDSSFNNLESLKDIIKDEDSRYTSQSIEERLKDDVVANAIINDGKYRQSGGDNADFLGSFQTHCLCLALRNGLLEKRDIENFVKERINSISGKIKGIKEFSFSDKISDKVAGACADAIQYFCLDKLIMDLTKSVYKNNLKVKKFQITEGHKKEATAMNLLLSNDILRQKILDKKYSKKYNEEEKKEKIEIVNGQDNIINCACSAILQSLPYSPNAYNNDKISLSNSNIFNNSGPEVEHILKGVLSDNAEIKEKDFSGQTQISPTPFFNGIGSGLNSEIVIYLCKNANSNTTGQRSGSAIGAFTLDKVEDVRTTGYKTLSFIGFSNDYNNVDLFERYGNSISYQEIDNNNYISSKKACIWRKNGVIVKDNEKLSSHPENYLFILHK